MSIIKREPRILDIYKSCLSDDEIEEYRNEITKQKNNPICDDLTTAEVAAKGATAMRVDNFRLVEDQLDV